MAIVVSNNSPYYMIGFEIQDLICVKIKLVFYFNEIFKILVLVRMFKLYKAYVIVRTPNNCTLNLYTRKADFANITSGICLVQ